MTASSPSLSSYSLSIGIDGGGSSTDITLLCFSSSPTISPSSIQSHDKDIILNDSTDTPVILFEVHSSCGSTNHNSVGWEVSRENLHEGIKHLVTQLSKVSIPSLSPLQNPILKDFPPTFTLQSITFGMSGCNTEKDSETIVSYCKSQLPFIYEQLASLATSASSLPFPFYLLTPSSPSPPPTPSICAFNDSVIALTSGTNGHTNGIVLICGTGMIGWGRREAVAKGPKITQNTNYKEMERVKSQGDSAPIPLCEWISGGNGCLIDDESGFGIGRKVLQIAFEVSDGRKKITKIGTEGKQEEGEFSYNETEKDHRHNPLSPTDPYSQLVHHVLSLSSPPANSMEDIVDFIYSPPVEWSKIAKFAPLAFEYSAVIKEFREILAESAEKLVKCALGIVDKLKWGQGSGKNDEEGKEIEIIPLVLVGGIAERDVMHSLISERMAVESKKRNVSFEVRKPTMDPSKAAAMMGIYRMKQSKS